MSEAIAIFVRRNGHIEPEVVHADSVVFPIVQVLHEGTVVRTLYDIEAWKGFPSVADAKKAAEKFIADRTGGKLKAEWKPRNRKRKT